MSATAWVWTVTALYGVVSFGAILVGLVVERVRKARAGADDH